MSGHGGNIYAASRRTGIPEEHILDFSASVNPLGVPEGAAKAIKDAIERLYHYPEPYSEGLTLCIARHLSVDPGTIICGNGSTELIYLVPRALRPGKILIPAPTFMEYERACAISGASEQVRLQLQPERDFDVPLDAFMRSMSGARPCDMAFLCNPNNPTGRLVARRDVLECADEARRQGCYLIVDEAFVDFCPEASVCNEVEKNPYLIVLRSMTKFYALSGVRIGCAVFHPSVAEKVKAYKEPWTVNSLAQKAAIAAIEDVLFRKASLEAMRTEKAFVERGLKGIGIRFVPSRANYYLLKLDRAPELRAALEERGILVRDCSGFPGLDGTYLRIAVRSRKENTILLQEMADICARLS
jgi:threonine-phosphate decarboxylase